MSESAPAPICYVATSGIHGKGLFAACAIPAGCRIGEYEGRPTTRDGDHVLWIEQDDGSYAGLRVENDLRFANHSSAPNAELDGAELWSLRPIGRGDEITVHYGSDWS